MEGVPSKLENMTNDPKRRFIRKGVLKKMNPYGKIQDRYIILLSDMLIYAKLKINKKKAEFKGMIPLDLCLIAEIGDPRLKKSKNFFHFNI